MSAADRMRRLRERRRTGEVTFRIVVPQNKIADLRALGWLAPDAPSAAAPKALIAMMEAALADGIAAIPGYASRGR
jgi:hypothetical protein